MSTATADIGYFFTSMGNPEIATAPKCQLPESERERPAWRPNRPVSISSVGKEFATEQAENQSTSFRLMADGISKTLESITSLAEEPEENDGYPGIPTPYALALAEKTVKSAGALLGPDVPAGSACSDVNGGIRITWRQGPREVCLVIPNCPGGRGYLYVHTGSRSDIFDDLSFDSLAARLMRLNSE